ncbi:cupin domain-containing protein [Teredinibacter turnerae]|uniref:cupin domain-containing protein n=1 Tax=Teredinibacter turnerae TaxID=2426 RepID=UPI0003758AA5|nr:cupin domain-containing protein [Teredinibacter turnerae]
MDATEIIARLSLEPHREGGFFRRTYEAGDQPRVITPNGERFSLTSIYYLLSSERPRGHFHRNRSDIVHYFHLGDPVEYFLIDPQGKLERVVMGTNLARGEQLQLVVPGGWWKASQLQANGINGFSLISEAVSPGFDYQDSELGKRENLTAAFPQHTALIRALTYEDAID